MLPEAGVLKLSPLYIAVITCEPGVNVDVRNDAPDMTQGPLAQRTVTGAPRLIEPSMNWTVPVAVVPKICAKKLTCCPTTEGLGDELTLTVATVDCAIASPDKRENSAIERILLVRDFMIFLHGFYQPFRMK